MMIWTPDLQEMLLYERKKDERLSFALSFPEVSQSDCERNLLSNLNII